MLLAAVVLNLGPAARGDEKPLSLRDIARMRHERVPLDKIVEKASQQGVSFAVAPGIEKQLSHLGFTAEQIDTIKQASGARAQAKDRDTDKDGKAATIVPGHGLPSSDEERDLVLQQVTQITKRSGVNLQAVASKHITLWAAKDDQATFMPDIKKVETFLENKCQEPLRSGLDKRSAHLVLLKTRYDYEKWIKASFEVMPDLFQQPGAPGGNAGWKASILKWPGFYDHNFVVFCTEESEESWLHRSVAVGVGFMNFVQQIEPQRHDPLATGVANGAESLVAGSPRVMIFSNSYHNEDRALGDDARGWLFLVQERMRTKKESGVGQLLNMDTTNMLLPQYAEAWTLAGMLSKQPETFGKLLLALREEKDPLKAIEQVYGWDEKKLQDAWRKEVLGRR